jgi:hypothetical protein
MQKRLERHIPSESIVSCFRYSLVLIVTIWLEGQNHPQASVARRFDQEWKADALRCLPCTPRWWRW